MAAKFDMRNGVIGVAWSRVVEHPLSGYLPTAREFGSVYYFLGHRGRLIVLDHRPPLWDVNETSVISGLMFSLTRRCTAVTLTATKTFGWPRSFGEPVHLLPRAAQSPNLAEPVFRKWHTSLAVETCASRYEVTKITNYVNRF